MSKGRQAGTPAPPRPSVFIGGSSPLRSCCPRPAMPESARMKLTPMLEQYLRVKNEHPDALLFFRLGDFYEMFFEDAERAAPILDVALTTRSKKDDVPIPMCGVPHFSVQAYIAKLLAAGLKV